MSKSDLELLNSINNQLRQDLWDKYCSGNISKWEMDSISCYIHDHELKKLKNSTYGFADFKVNDPNRQIRPTDYSICQGAITENGFATGWLTRSAENVLGGSVMMADCYGKDYGFYTFCDDPNSCVVPLLWINLSE